MKKASRFMPKYIPPHGGNAFILSGMLIVMAAALSWLILEYPLFLVFLLALGVWTYLENKRRKRKFDAITAERNELSICDFGRSFDSHLVDTWVVRAVYEQIQNYISESDVPLPIKAEDGLFDTLDIDVEDLEFDLLEEIAQRTGRSLENTKSNPYYGKINTVRELVYFINEQPNIEPHD